MIKILLLSSVLALGTPNMEPGAGTTAPGSAINYKRVDNREMVRILNGFTLFSEMFTEQVSVRVLCVYDESGAEAGSCDKTTSLYVAVSSFGDCPNQNVYKLSSIFGPRFVKWIKDDPKRPMMQIEYGTPGKRKSATVRVSLQGLAISEKLTSQKF